MKSPKIAIRKSWGNLDPSTKIQPLKTKEYKRSEEKAKLSSYLDEQTDDFSDIVDPWDQPE